MKYLMSEVLIKLNKLELLDWPRLIESKEKLSFVNYDISRWTEPGKFEVFGVFTMHACSCLNIYPTKAKISTLLPDSYKQYIHTNLSSSVPGRIYSLLTAHLGHLLS